MKKVAYIFIDEGGNFDFSSNGTGFFTLTAVTKFRPFLMTNNLVELKYDSIENGLELEYFHASEDKYPIRNAVFDEISTNIDRMRIDSIIVEKRKTHPSLHEQSKFYSTIMYYLLQYIDVGLKEQEPDEIIIIMDKIPVKRKKQAILKSIKTNLHALDINKSYKVMTFDSKSTLNLQIADYVNWAIYRKWDRNDLINYNKIRKGIISEFDIFQSGQDLYY